MKSTYLLILSLMTSTVFAGITVRNISDLEGNYQTVSHIDLSNKGLTEFPMEILRCKNAVSINLSNNGIGGIPLKLAKLKSLKHLDLSENQGLDMTDLDSVLSKADFDLLTIDLHDCALTYAGSNLSSQKNLERIDLSENLIQTIPYTYINLKKLEDINLSKNHLADISWHIGYWWNLKKIDTRDNPLLDNHALLTALSFLDKLDKVKVSNVSEFPKQFQYLNVDDFTIEHSNIERFPRTQLSNKIDRLHFSDCRFMNTQRMAEVINQFVKPNFVGFDGMPAENLAGFLNLNVDSVELSNAGEVNMQPLIGANDLKWLDLRKATYDASSSKKFNKAREDVEVLYGGQINNDVGINAPLEHLVAEPTIVKVDGGQANEVQIGKTNFSIPQDCFIDQNGDVYRGDVDLEYTEYMEMEDVILSGIPMTVEKDGETKMMSTGGMFSLYAKDERGNDLEMNPTKNIMVDMQTKSTNPDMQLWEFADDGKWKAVGTDSLITPYNMEYDELDSVLSATLQDLDKMDFQYFSDRYVPEVKWVRKEKSFTISFDRYKTSFPGTNYQVTQSGLHLFNPKHGANFISKQTLLYNGENARELYEELKEMRKYCKKQYKKIELDKLPFPFNNIGQDVYSRLGPNYVTGIKVVPDYEADNFSLQFRFKGEQFNLGVVQPTETISTTAAMREPDALYKTYVSSLRRSLRTKRRNESRMRPVLARYNMELRNASRRSEAARQAYLDGFPNDQTMDFQRDVSQRRRFSMPRLGLFNCDGLLALIAPVALVGIGIAAIGAGAAVLVANGVSAGYNAIKYRNRATTRRFVKRGSGELIEVQAQRVVYSDDDKMGTLTFEKGEEVVIDGAANSRMVVFFSKNSIGIFNSRIDKVTDREIPVQMHDIQGKSREEVKKIMKDA